LCFSTFSAGVIPERLPAIVAIILYALSAGIHFRRKFLNIHMWLVSPDPGNQISSQWVVHLCWCCQSECAVSCPLLPVFRCATSSYSLHPAMIVGFVVRIIFSNDPTVMGTYVITTLVRRIQPLRIDIIIHSLSIDRSSCSLYVFPFTRPPAHLAH
jgi:hypothetical protein